MTEFYRKKIKSAPKCAGLDARNCADQQKLGNCIHYKPSKRRTDYCAGWPGTQSRVYTKESAMEEVSKLIEDMKAAGISNESIRDSIIDLENQFNPETRVYRPGKRTLKRRSGKPFSYAENFLAKIKTPSLLQDINDEEYEKLIFDISANEEVCSKLSADQRAKFIRRLNPSETFVKFSASRGPEDCKNIRDYITSSIAETSYADDVNNCLRDRPSRRDLIARVSSSEFGRPIPPDFYSDPDPRYLCDAIRLIQGEENQMLEQVEPTIAQRSSDWWSKRSPRSKGPAEVLSTE